MKITKKQKYIIGWGGGILLVSIAIAVPLIVQSTKQKSTSFNLTTIKTHMQTATKSTASLAETQVAIVKMYQNSTTEKLSLKAQNAAHALAQYIHVNKARQKFAFVLGKDHQDQQLLLLTIANHPATPQANASLQKVISQALTSTQKQDDLSLATQLSWVTNALQQAEFGILFWIYQNRLSSQEAIAGNALVPLAIKVVNFQRIKTPHKQLQGLVQAAIQQLVASDFTTGINKTQIASTSALNKAHVMRDIKKQINNIHAKELILLGDIAITSNNMAQTITIVIHNHGPSKTIIISGFISIKDYLKLGSNAIKDYLDQVLNAIPSSGGAFVIPEGITSSQFHKYVQAMGSFWDKEGNLVMNMFAKQYRAKITSLTIPNSFTMIGTWFWHFNKITSLFISNSVTTIGTSAFQGAPLTTLSLGDHLQTIKGLTFSSALLTSLHIPASITLIEYLAFQNSPLINIKVFDDVRLASDAFKSSVKIIRVKRPTS